MPDPIISIPWTDDSPVLDFNGLRARVASLEETGRLNAEEYIKAQAETTRWAARCGVEKGKREQAEARVAELEAQTPSALKAKLDSAEARIAELEALHKTYYNQPFAEACQRAASEERERTLSIVRSVEEEADMDTEHGVGWSQACRSIDNSITKP